MYLQVRLVEASHHFVWPGFAPQWNVFIFIPIRFFMGGNSMTEPVEGSLHFDLRLLFWQLNLEEYWSEKEEVDLDINSLKTLLMCSSHGKFLDSPWCTHQFESCSFIRAVLLQEMLSAVFRGIEFLFFFFKVLLHNYKILVKFPVLYNISL